MVSFTPRPLYPQVKSPCFLLDRGLDGPQSRSGRGGEEKNSQPLLGLEPPIIQPVAQRYTTEPLLCNFMLYVKYQDSLQICRAGVNVFIKQFQTVDKGWLSSLGFGRGVNKSTP
jgi:hypothetical protein